MRTSGFAHRGEAELNLRKLTVYNVMRPMQLITRAWWTLKKIRDAQVVTKCNEFVMQQVHNDYAFFVWNENLSSWFKKKQISASVRNFYPNMFSEEAE